MKPIVKNMENKNIRVRVAGILLNGKNELLLVNHQKNGKSYWLLPGGGVEFGESFHEALKREFMEELSMEIGAVGELFLVHDTVYPDKKRHIVNLYFTVKAVKNHVLKVNPDGVLAGAKFVSIKDFKKLLFYPDIKGDIIIKWKKRFRQPLGYMKIKWKE
jgi:ADP-ribose pyrophosphatase YjhB (NUDIX family)